MPQSGAAPRVVELRFFAGLGGAEIAAEMDSSPATVQRVCQFVKAWLYDRMQIT